MFESYTIKRLQAETNRWAASFDPSTPVQITGVLDKITAQRALTILEHVQILSGDTAGRQQTQEAYKDPIPAVTAQLKQLLEFVTAAGDAEKKPPAVFVFPTMQVGFGLGALGLVFGVFWLATRKPVALALPPADFDEEDFEEVDYLED